MARLKNWKIWYQANQLVRARALLSNQALYICLEIDINLYIYVLILTMWILKANDHSNLIPICESLFLP